MGHQFFRGVVVGAVVASVVMLTGTALAGTGLGAVFNLGRTNSVSQTSTLINCGSGPALSLKVKAGKPPLVVNSMAKVARLNADTVDGMHPLWSQRTLGHSFVGAELGAVPNLGVLKGEGSNNALRPTFVNTSQGSVTVAMTMGEPTADQTEVTWRAILAPGQSYTPASGTKGNIDLLVFNSGHLASLQVWQVWSESDPLSVQVLVVGSVR